MSDREQRELHGAVKSITEESTFPGVTDASGNSTPEIRSESTTEFDPGGGLMLERSKNPDGSSWVRHNEYDQAGKLLKIASGIEGQVLSETIYSYDLQGRLQKIISPDSGKNPISFSYDDLGRKTSIMTSRPEDYRANMASGGSPFEATQMLPNVPGGGTATTIYDEQNRAVEVVVRDSNGEIVNRATRKYDEQGRIAEEKQILDNPATMFPLEFRTQMAQQAGVSADQFMEELSAQIAKFMVGKSLYSVSYRYDAKGRLKHSSRQIFNQSEEIETSYSEYGEIESEITRRVRHDNEADPNAGPLLPEYLEVRYSYRHDERGNWIEKTVSYRSNPDGAFQSSSVTKRTLTYY